MRICLFCEHKYAVDILRPIQGASDGKVCLLMSMSALIALIFILTFYLISHDINGIRHLRWKKCWKWFENTLTIWFVGVWIFGFCVYCAGMYIIDGDASDWEKLIEVSPMALIDAFGMFALQNDISAIQSQFHTNLLYMFCFSLAHFGAVLVSMGFVIKHFGYSFVAMLRLWMTSHLSKGQDYLYVFWGMDDQSFTLAKDIKLNDPNKDSHRIIFVKTEDNTEAIASRNEINRLLNFVFVRNQALEQLNDLDCLYANVFHKLSFCELNDAGTMSGTNFIRDKLRLKSLARLLKKTNIHVHIIILGDDEDNNINIVAKLCLDNDLVGYVNNSKCKRNLTIHCHARYDNVNNIITYANIPDRFNIQLIDSDHLALETLKRSDDELCSPVGFVDVKPNATVSNQFKSMVIGMGQCGQDAVKYLYEYGAFVSSQRSSNGDILRSVFRCDVFDDNMKDIGSLFQNMRPGADIGFAEDSSAIRQTKGKNSKVYNITLHNSDAKGNSFWEFVRQNITDENCIFITTKDDNAGITLAVRLLIYAIRSNADINRLRIFVRSYHRELLPDMQRIANHYNQSVTKSLGLVNQQPIYIFGAEQEIFTWCNIIDDRMLKDSICYYNSYKQLVEFGTSFGSAWKDRRKQELGEPPYGYRNINAIHRMELQDKENALHRQTKIRLIRKALGNDEKKLLDLAEAVSNVTKSDGNTYRLSTQNEEIMTTLAQTEHLRWNASHEILGYTYDKDVHRKERDVKMRHDNLTSWNNLDTIIQEYDYNIVETTLRMYLQDKKCN